MIRKRHREAKKVEYSATQKQALLFANLVAAGFIIGGIIMWIMKAVSVGPSSTRYGFLMTPFINGPVLVGLGVFVFILKWLVARNDFNKK
jgi:cytochrome b subunit of formate dehydrogenase